MRSSFAEMCLFVKRSSRRYAPRIAAVAIVIGAAALQPAAAQESPSLSVDVGDCVALEKPEDRLACFEAQVEAARQRPPAPARSEPAGSSTGSGLASPQAQPTEIVAKITALRETVPNAYVITLDNGQVWRQTQPLVYRLRVGLEVRLRSSRFGNDWRLSAPDLGGQIRVERVP
jgi:hypothetical protein